MSKYKAGLHKDVSAIFNGVSLPKNDITQQPSAAPAPGHQDYSAPKPPSITSPAVPKQPSTESPVSSPAAPKQPSTASPVSSPAVPKQPSTESPVSSPAAPKPAAPESPTQKPRAPSHMTPTKPKPERMPLQSPPEAAPAKQHKADTAAKAAVQPQWQRKLDEIKIKLFTPKPGVSATKQKVMVMAVPVLFIVLVFVFIRLFSSPSRNMKGPKTGAPVKAAAAGSDRKVDWKVPGPYPTTLRDPMQFGSARGQTGAGGLVVQGIVYSEDNPSAVIDGHIVHQGDKILDVVITKINENSVEFEANNKKWTQNIQR